MKRTHKLKNRGGFTLAETLLAVLILLLVSTIVATGIPVAARVYEKTVLSANAQSLLSTTVSALRDELGTAWDVEVADNVVTYYSADTGNRSKLEIVEEGGQKNIKLTEFLSIDALKRKFEVAGGSGTAITRTLIPDATLTRDLDITYDTVSYTYDPVADLGIVEFANLQVTPKGKTTPVIAQMESLKIRIAAASPTPTPTPAPTLAPTSPSD